MATAAGVPVTPAAGNLPRRRVLIIIGALLLGMLLAALDQTIVSTALPTIVGDLGGATHLAWVVTAYLLSSTVCTPLWGKLGDLYGRKMMFQLSIGIFLVGSALSGFSHSMVELIAFRALQGIGGGGLMVGAQAIIGDVVSPRERGRYMGIFGAVFGVTTVVGPLLGGLFVEYLSWRWVFYINLPVGIVALLVTASALPSDRHRVRRVVDWTGTLLLALGATALILFTSLGGTSYPWGSPAMIALAAGGVALTVAFCFAERRAVEPVVPLGLFRNRVFSVASAVGFAVGFAMFGALTFLPLYEQIVNGVSATQSGVRIFPVMLGLLMASTISGQLVSRWGRYKIFPVLGTALMALGLYLVSLVGIGTNAWVASFYMFVLGAGLGLVMQVLVVAVQNAVPYEQLGVATSGATFFRQIGGSFGTAVCGAIYANQLVVNLTRYLHGVSLPKNVGTESLDPTALAHVPPVVHAAVVHGVAATIQSVFLYTVPVGVLAFGLSWLLPELELRRVVRAGADTGEGFAMPEDRTSLQEVERQVAAVARRENRGELYRQLAARAGLELQPGSCWLLYRLSDQPACSLTELAERLKVPLSRLEPFLHGLSAAGMATLDGGDDMATSDGVDDMATSDGVDGAVGAVDAEPSDAPIVLTATGRDAMGRLTEARRQGLTELLEGWDPDDHPELADLVRKLAEVLLADDHKLLEAARPSRRATV